MPTARVGRIVATEKIELTGPVIDGAEPSAERGIIDDRGDDPANPERQDPIPVFRAAGAAAENDVILEARYNRLPKIHDAPPAVFPGPHVSQDSRTMWNTNADRRGWRNSAL